MECFEPLFTDYEIQSFNFTLTLDSLGEASAPLSHMLWVALLGFMKNADEAVVK